MSMKRNTLDNFIEKRLKDEEFAKEFRRQLIINEIAAQIVRIRKSIGLTQEQLARKAGTTQPVIARLEKGNDKRLPSLDLVDRIAQATNMKLHVSLSF